MIINSITYGTGIQFIFDSIFLIVSGIQNAIVIIYALLKIEKHTLYTGVLGLFVLAFVILVFLFIFNASFWNTDTGTFIYSSNKG